MVQYRTSNDTTELHYWKLSSRMELTLCGELRHRLREAGYFHFTNANLGRLRYLQGRAERGLMSYDSYDNMQLRNFCIARKIEIPTNVKGSKAGLRALIERNDDQGTTCAKFLALPAELRLEVYGHYIAWLGDHITESGSATSHQEAHDFLAPPPLAHTCQLVRNEVLPLFYQSFRWKIRFDDTKLYENGSPRRNPIPSLHIKTSRFFRLAPLELIHMITKVQIEGKYIFSRSFKITCHDTWSGNFAQGAKLARIDSKYHSPRPVHAPESFKVVELTVCEFIERDLRRVFDVMMRREDGGRFEREDADTIVEIYVRAQETALQMRWRDVAAAVPLPFAWGKTPALSEEDLL